MGDTMFRRVTPLLFDHVLHCLAAIGAAIMFIAAAFAPPHTVLEQQTNDAICAQGESASVAGLKAALTRGGGLSSDAATHVLQALASARRHCARGETAKAAVLYAQARQMLARSNYELLAGLQKPDPDRH